MKHHIWKKIFVILLLCRIIGWPLNCHATELKETHIEENAEEMIKDLDLQEIQDAADEMLGEYDYSISDHLKKLLQGDSLDFWNAGELVKEYLTNLWQNWKNTLIQIMVLVLVAGILTNFTDIFQNGQMSEISFYVVYLLLFVLLVSRFMGMAEQMESKMQQLLEFMRTLAPAYYLAVTASQGAGSAVAFYEIMLVLFACEQWVMMRVLLPAINIYVMMKLINYLSKEELLTRFTELLLTLIQWTLRLVLSLVIGMQTIRQMVEPALDSFRRTIIGKTASSIPAIGDAIDAVTEMVIGSAVLIRNCLGAVVLIVLFISMVYPVLYYGMHSLGYRALGAVTQPISDKRITGCLETFGEGCALLLKLYCYAQILLIVSIAMIGVSFRG